MNADMMILLAPVPPCRVAPVASRCVPFTPVPIQPVTGPARCGAVEPLAGRTLATPKSRRR
jgi:hypothetical protein